MHSSVWGLKVVAHTPRTVFRTKLQRYSILPNDWFLVFVLGAGFGSDVYFKTRG